MFALVEDSSVVIHFFPSLLHLAAVEEALQLLTYSNFEVLKIVYRNIQEGKLINWDSICDDPENINLIIKFLKCKKAQLECKLELLECKTRFVKRKGELKNRQKALKKRIRSLKKKMLEISEANPLIKWYRIQQNLLMIPPGLRKTVMEAVQGLVRTCRQWIADHSRILKLKDVEFMIYLKSDGRIDEIKTVQQLVLNSKIDIRMRFCLACTYCFEESIKALWAEMVAIGQTETFITASNSMVHFWINRLRQGSQIPWIRDFCKYLRHHPEFMPLRYSSFFHLLQPRHRERFLPFLQFAKFDDFLLCLSAMTEEEEEAIMEFNNCRLFHCYLQWPLRSLFLELVGKLWRYIDDFCFRFLFNRLYFIQRYDEFDNSKLFEDFWNMSPTCLRETAKECPQMREKIDFLLNEIRRKKKALVDEFSNSNPKRLDGNK
ncbi:unnamed protein product [Larinioides sclopetarius]|uniref:Uncharacterized protein n=1 Tax=Larinioides sclopetarius TaxID=280406 RepID=A0AAV2BYW0_9ARAC